MAMDQGITIAVAGCTGAVGQEFIALLEQRDLPVGEIRLLASARSAGRRVQIAGRDLTVGELGETSFKGVDIAFFCAGGAVSRECARAAVDCGCTVIDNSSAFRMDPQVPLIVPEINGDLLDELDGPALIANPNCSTIIALMAVTPLHRAVGVKRMVISTYQAASGGGSRVVAALEQQARDWAAGRPSTTDVLGRQYIFNVYSHDSAMGPDGYNQEETKLLLETRKIWADDDVAVTATCVRVPVLRAHCESINITFREPLGEDEARALIAGAPGVTLIDDRAKNLFPEPIDASGKDDVLVGRIRADRSQPPGHGLDLFVAGDQLRKGAALNGIQIAERLIARGVSSRAGSAMGSRR